MANLIVVVRSYEAIPGVRCRNLVGLSCKRVTVDGGCTHPHLADLGWTLKVALRRRQSADPDRSGPRDVLVVGRHGLELGDAPLPAACRVSEDGHGPRLPCCPRGAYEHKDNGGQGFYQCSYLNGLVTGSRWDERLPLCFFSPPAAIRSEEVELSGLLAKRSGVQGAWARW
jgi:hypothetical protein